VRVGTLVCCVWLERAHDTTLPEASEPLANSPNKMAFWVRFRAAFVSFAEVLKAASHDGTF